MCTQRTLREEAEKLQKRNEGLGVDLQALKEQLTSQKQEWSTDREHWETKVCLWLYIISMRSYITAHIHVYANADS